MLQLYKNIKNKRKMLGMSQEELAKKTGYTDRSSIAKIELGNVDLPQSKIIAFAEALQTTPSALMGWVDELEIVTPEETTQESTLLYSFRNLNTKGKGKVTSYVADLSATGQYKKDEDVIEEEAATYEIPLLGNAAAGEPISYGDPSYETIKVKRIPRGAEFALIIDGDSMEPDIMNGSIVFIRPQLVAENGETVVVEIDGEVTCKKFHRDNGGNVEFRSINLEYEPITEFEECRIIGRVIF